MTERNPMNLSVRSVNTVTLSLDKVLLKIENLIKEYKDFNALVDFDKIWRVDTRTVDQKTTHAANPAVTIFRFWTFC